MPKSISPACNRFVCLAPPVSPVHSVDFGMDVPIRILEDSFESVIESLSSGSSPAMTDTMPSLQSASSEVCDPAGDAMDVRIAARSGARARAVNLHVLGRPASTPLPDVIDPPSSGPDSDEGPSAPTAVVARDTAVDTPEPPQSVSHE